MNYRFEYGCDNNYLDVTSIVMNNFVNTHPNIVTINDIYYNDYFTDPSPQILKYLKITNLSNNIVFYWPENTNLTLDLNEDITYQTYFGDLKGETLDKICFIHCCSI